MFNFILQSAIAFLEFKYRKEDKLLHRDFLGSLMSLQFTRDVIGDILIKEGSAFIAVKEVMAGHIIQNIDKIGRTGVEISLTGPPDRDVSSRNYQELSGTVSSLRLDCIAALAVRQSRSKIQVLISAGRVSVNHVETLSPAVQIKSGDIITIRGYGKFVLGDIISVTKKGRHHINLKKYI